MPRTQSPKRILALLAAVLLMNGTRAARAQETTLTLSWIDWYGLFDVGNKGIATEVERLFEELGIDVLWIEDETIVTEREPHEIPVLLRPTEPAALDFAPETMGAVFGHRGPKPVIWVFFPSVVRAVLQDRYGPDAAMIHVPESPRFQKEQKLNTLRRKAWLNRGAVATLIARVILHEVVHIVTPLMPHAKEGLMSQKMTCRSIASENAGLDPESLAVFRQGLRSFFETP